MKRKICIVGGVAGGATAAAKLRRLSESDEIIMFEKDEYISFANCGLPYYVGQTIKNRDDLLVQSIQDMEKRFNLDIRNFSEVLRIDRKTKEIIVKDISGNKVYRQPYDVLILSPGASPIVPPIPGLDEASNVFILRNIPHVDAIDRYIQEHNPKHVTVIGGGFIGVEMAENLKERGLQVTVVDMAAQVLAPVDYEMAQVVHQELTRHGVKLVLNDGVKAFFEQGRVVETASGTRINTDMIVLAIGVSSEIKLAKEAGLEIGELRAIKVNEFMQTSDSNIYALGDAVEVKSRINHKQIKIPLAWPANRQAIVVANHINDVNDRYPGSLGTAVAKVFDLTVASTGFNEKLCQIYNMDYEVVHVNRNNHASYYPNAMPILLKVIFNPNSGEIYGAQAVGNEGTEKRIDVLATAMIGKLSVTDLADLELAYAPPYGSAKDPVNILGYVATHVFDKTTKTIQWHQLDAFIKEGGYVLDVRTLEEYKIGHIALSKHIDVDDLRNNMNILPNKDTKIVITCQVGHRGYVASRILQEKGYRHVYNLDGGYYLYEIAHHDFVNESEFKPIIEATNVDH